MAVLTDEPPGGSSLRTSGGGSGRDAATRRHRAGAPLESVGPSGTPAGRHQRFKNQDAKFERVRPCACQTLHVKPTAERNGEAVVFLAYPGSSPLTAECMRETAKELNKRGVTSLVWEDLPIQGRLMIQQVLDAIDGASALLAEVSELNFNVLFELGFAIARDKHVWAVLDESDTGAVQYWRDFGLLAGVGRVDYSGSSTTLVHKFSQARPDLSPKDTLWSDLYAKIRSSRSAGSLFHYSTAARDDGARAVQAELDRRPRLSVVNADEDERGAAPLEWYVDQIHRASSVLIHLMSPTKQRAHVHNARASFLAGIAHGMERPLLMIAPPEFGVPLDYRDLLQTYETVRNLQNRLGTWLDDTPGATTPARPPGKTKLDVEIPISFGEYVAEDERAELSDYFVNTAEYQKVMSSGTAIFVGRKGTGKTATMLRATDELRSDKRILVVPIKPSGYELEALVEVISRLPDKATVDYFMEGLWKYLLYAEVACAAVAEGEVKPAGIPSGSKLAALASLLDEHDVLVSDGFAVRLEKVVAEVLHDVEELPASVQEQRGFLNQRLHAASLHDLRRAIGEALADRDRVAVLIDNLDKAWERGANYKLLSRMIFGLLTAVGKVASDFSREDMWKRSVNLTLAVFLRADIFSVVRKFAREPDKIKTLQVRWTNSALLARVIEDRYVAAKDGDAEPEDVWEFFFCFDIDGMRTKEYLLWRCLPRPRDVIYLCNAAVLHAVNARRSSVEAADVRAAEEEYSLFAFEALLVESDPHAGLSNLLFEFAGQPATIEQIDLRALLSPHVPDVDETIGTLLRASFLGIEVDDGRFDFPLDETSEQRALVLSRRLKERLGREARFRVHPAYRPYLEIADDDL